MNCEDHVLNTHNPRRFPGGEFIGLGLKLHVFIALAKFGVLRFIGILLARTNINFGSSNLVLFKHGRNNQMMVIEMLGVGDC